MPRFHSNLNGSCFSIEPSGTRQRTSPLTMSMATSSPQGGAVQGAPQGDSNQVRLVP